MLRLFQRSLVFHCARACGVLGYTQVINHAITVQLPWYIFDTAMVCKYIYDCDKKNYIKITSSNDVRSSLIAYWKTERFSYL